MLASPFEEFQLADGYGFQPLALRHFGLREALAPSPTLRLWKVDERTVVDLEPLELLEQLRTRDRSKAVARPRHVNELLPVVVPKDQGIEGLGPTSVAANHELLPAI